MTERNFAFAERLLSHVEDHLMLHGSNRFRIQLIADIQRLIQDHYNQGWSDASTCRENLKKIYPPLNAHEQKPIKTPEGDTSEAYPARMGIENASDIANKIWYWGDSGEETDYYAVKYGRRMIEALMEVECRKRGAI